MKLGVTFPQTEIGRDPGAIREFAQAAEEMGFDHLGAYEHVLGANPNSRPEWRSPYTHMTTFHEPFVLFGYLAAITSRIELVTQVLILPQRPTALVAKQAAELDVLSNGRLRLGIGVGWNEVEYEALGQNFHDRGRRIEEQVRVLRELWTHESVTFKGRWHQITDAGINPMPVQRPIPIWMGGENDAVLKRIARLADGCFPRVQPDESGNALIERLQAYIKDAGREPNDVGIQGGISARTGAEQEWVNTAESWSRLGATHLSFNTMGAGFTKLDEHLTAMHRFMDSVGKLRVSPAG
jgi:probable F420-dependent oxidoreductase